MKQCFYCGVELVKVKGKKGVPDPSNKMTKDHLIPKCKGGGGIADNTVISCEGCNNEKGRLTMEEYRLVIGFRNNNLSIQSHHKFFGEQ